MTDNEIIKAYEGLTSNQQLNLFRNLYYNDGFSTEKGIVANAIDDILPKYCKQQEEIDNLRTDLKRVCAERDAHIATTKFIRAEAVKEFAERLEEYSYESMGNYGIRHMVVSVKDIDNLVKEMVGNDNVSTL